MSLTDNQLELFGLCFGCPEITPLSDCPLEKHRKKTAIEKMKFIERLSLDESKRLVEAHEKCLKKRVQDRLFVKAM